VAVTVQVERLAGGGKGVAHHDGETWFVAGALPGETVAAEAVRRRAGIVEAETVTVLADPSPDRHPDPCPHAPSCGGCDWPHVTPDADAALKREAAAGSARGTPELAARLLTAPLQSSPLAYRLRSRLHWRPEAGVLGFYSRRSWEPVAIPSCRIVSPRLAEAIPRLAEALAASADGPVDLEWLEDLEGAVAVVGLRPARGGPGSIPPAWLPERTRLEGIVDGCHVLSASGALAAGWGTAHVVMRLPIPLEVPIGAFFQGNRHLVPWLFTRVGELAPPGEEPMWDLHAGVGLLAAAVLDRGPRAAVLVEPYRPSALAAARNLPDAKVAVGRTAEAYLGSHRRLPRKALVLTDPPRAGLTAELRSRLAGWHPRTILMLGCDPATWARDAGFLIERGYELTHVELIDLFPSTHHVEVLAVLVSE